MLVCNACTRHAHIWSWWKQTNRKMPTTINLIGRKLPEATLDCVLQHFFQFYFGVSFFILLSTLCKRHPLEALIYLSHARQRLVNSLSKQFCCQLLLQGFKSIKMLKICFKYIKKIYILIRLGWCDVLFRYILEFSIIFLNMILYHHMLKGKTFLIKCKKFVYFLFSHNKLEIILL